MIIWIVGLCTCLGTKIIVSYIANSVLPKLRNTQKDELKTSDWATNKEIVSNSEHNNNLLIKTSHSEELNQHEVNKLKKSLNEFSYNCGTCYLEALLEIERSLLNFDNRVRCYTEIMQTLGKACKVSRVYIFENNFSDDGDLMMNLQAEWCVEGMQSKINNHPWHKLSYTKFCPSWLKLLARGDIVSQTVAELGEAESQTLELQGILTISMLPIIAKGNFVGFIGFDSCEVVKIWESKEIAFLQAVAGVLSLAHDHLLADNALKKSF